MQPEATRKKMKNAMRVVALAVPLLSTSLPASVFMYWTGALLGEVHGLTSVPKLAWHDGRLAGWQAGWQLLQLPKGGMESAVRSGHVSLVPRLFSVAHT